MNKDSNTTTCPNCSASECYIHRNNNPPQLDMACYNCGFQVTTVISYLNLEQLNEQRKVNDMEPLSELPIQNLYS